MYMELSEQLNFLDRLKTELDGQRPLPEEVTRKINTKLRLDWNYHSNAIEGNTLSYGETKALLLHDRYIGNHEGRFYREILGHDSVIKDLILNVSDLVTEQVYPLSQSLIRDLHKSMLVDEYYSEAITPDGQPTAKKIVPGQYKTLPNSVRKSNGEMFFYTEPTDVEFEMNSLLETYRTNPEGLHPVAMAAYFHYRFIRIHPFDDGNGRLSRILMNLLLFRAGFVPAIIPVPERSRYIEILGTVDATNNLAPFVAYIAEKVQHIMQMELKAARGEDITEPGDADKKLKLLARQLSGQTPGYKEKRSRAFCARTVDIFVFPFLEAIERNVLKFTEVAQEVYSNFTCMNQSFNTVAEFKEAVLLLQNQPQYNFQYLTNFSSSFAIQGFKKQGIEKYNLNGRIEIFFYDYDVQIVSDRNEVTFNSFAYNSPVLELLADEYAEKYFAFLVDSVAVIFEKATD